MPSSCASTRRSPRSPATAADECIGQTPKLLSSGSHDASFYAAMRESIERNGVWQGEIWNRRKNGEVFPEWLTISAVRDGDGVVTHYVSALTDMSAAQGGAGRDPASRLL
jgi:PAS domain-containing protein